MWKNSFTEYRWFFFRFWLKEQTNKQKNAFLVSLKLDAKLVNRLIDLWRCFKVSNNQLGSMGTPRAAAKHFFKILMPAEFRFVLIYRAETPENQLTEKETQIETYQT